MYSCIGDELKLKGNYLSDKPVMTKLFPDKSVVYVDSGRSGIYCALKELSQRGFKKAWLPRYVCSAITLPFIQAGYEIGYYSNGSDFRTLSKLPDVEDNSIIHYVHYLGMKNTAAEEWISDLRTKKHVVVIEDCVQATLNDNVGNFGDYSIYSFRKFLPMPDGGAITSNCLLSFDLNDSDEGYVSKKLLAKTIGRDIGDQEFNNWLVRLAEDVIDQEIIPRKMSWASRYVLDSIDLERIKTKRIKNWNALASMISEIDEIEPLGTLNKGEVPLAFPIKVLNGQRDELYSYLTRSEIMCRPKWWPVYDPKWKEEYELAQTYLSLPINQDMDENDLKNICSEIKQFFRKEK